MNIKFPQLFWKKGIIAVAWLPHNIDKKQSRKRIQKMFDDADKNECVFTVHKGN